MIIAIFATLIGGLGMTMMFECISIWIDSRSFYKFSNIFEDWTAVWFTGGLMMVLFVIYVLLNTF